jgi:hypothetical protein
MCSCAGIDSAHSNGIDVPTAHTVRSEAGDLEAFASEALHQLAGIHAVC